MASHAGWLRKRILGISYQEATFAARGFRARSAERRERLEHVGRVFLRGYHMALEHSDLSALAGSLDAVEPEVRGFAYEGAAMGITLLDFLSLWRQGRLEQFLAGAGAKHVYMVHVGAGWVLARLHGRYPRLQFLDPMLRWLCLDGYGFHEGYFHPKSSVDLQAVPNHLTGYARRAFDQGLGRSLWFVEGADTDRMPIVVDGFPAARRADLWSGIGLACAYAGGAEPQEIRRLLRSAGGFASCVGQGAAFAAKARRLAGIPARHTEMACDICCGASADGAADLCDAGLDGLCADEENPAYEVWRRRIQTRLQKAVSTV